ncbi:G-protein coupled receptor 157-like [Halichondria panicea]|uniref:G-protein coupled receptor 157-like n=1 Tax=Halichondria panicea TaxID=6063 RepID=UPI00312B4D6D
MYQDNGTLITEPGFIKAVQVTAGITSILSTLGASLIIFIYIAFRNLRTTARQLLVSLSIADIIVAISHFVGLFANFKRFIYQYNNETWNTSTTDPLCITQAAFSMFGTLASFLLSLAIGVYLVGILVWKKPRSWKKLFPIFYIICWGLPAIVVIPNLAKRLFGFALGANIGWCFIAQQVDSSNSDYVDYVITEYLSYEIWVCIVFIALPVLYLTAFIYIRCKRQRNNYENISSSSLPQGGDLKLLFVPVVFLLLRIWSTVLDNIVYHTTDEETWLYYLNSPGIAALVIIAGIGDNAQGLVNAILFCALTKQVRQQLFSKQYYVNVCGRHNIQPISAVDENTQCSNDRHFYDNKSSSYAPSVQFVASHSSASITIT